MPYLLRTLRLLALVVWVGGIVFFAFVVAPVAFHYLPNPHDAGLVVRNSLLVLHWIGLACGTLFALSTLLLVAFTHRRAPTNLALQLGLIVLMVLLTVASQCAIMPAMERDRVQAGGDITQSSLDNPARVDFERLHVLSERVEGAVLFLGLGVCLLLVRNPTEESA